MKKRILVLGMSTLLLCGCGKVPQLTNGDEAVVTFKDNEGISANDFYNEIKNTMGLETLINMIDKYIYEKEFSSDKADANTYAEATLKNLRANYESDDQILSALKYYGMNFQTIEAYQNYVYISYLQNIGTETYVKNNITDDELKDYYEKNVYPSMTISHILITPTVTDDMDEDEQSAAEDEAKDKVNSLIKELNQAKKDGKDIEEVFANLAKNNSEDDSTKNDGGNLGEINIGSLGSSYDELVKAAFKLNDGEYSTTLITTELGYHIILKTKTGEKASYEDSLDSMKESIASDKLSNDQSLSIEAIRYYRKKYELDIIDKDMDTQYSKYMNNLINTYKSNS